MSEFKITEKLEEEIAEAAGRRGRVSIKIKILIYRLIYHEVKISYKEYRKTADLISGLHSIRVSESLEKKIEEEFTETKRSIPGQNLIYPRLVSSYAGYAIAIMTILVFVITYSVSKIEEQEKVYTKEEIVKADKDVRLALMMISKVLKKTENELTREVVPNRIEKPIKSGIKTIKTLFNGG